MKRNTRKRNALPEWADKVEKLRQRLQLSQSALGQQLQYSAIFWERAGLKSSNVLRVLPDSKKVFPKSAFPDFDIVVAGSGNKARSKKKTQLVAIPLLGVHAGTHGEKGDKTLDLDKVPAEDMIAAPAAWCPHPATTSCLRVKGMSMSPLIHDGDILAVDYSEANHADLDGKIVVAWHKDKGLCVSRFRRYRGVEVLEAENRDYETVTLGSDRNWRIVGKILWWTRLAP
jgi:SOS-response transcriptional repressor LexA